MEVSSDDHRMQDHDSPLSSTAGDTPPPLIEGRLKHPPAHPLLNVSSEHSL